MAVEDRDKQLLCRECKHEMKRTFDDYRLSRAKEFLWNGGDPLTLEHAAENPITFNNRKELKSFCKQKGFNSGAL